MREIPMSWQPLIGGARKDRCPMARLAAAIVKAVRQAGERDRVGEVGFIH